MDENTLPNAHAKVMDRPVQAESEQIAWPNGWNIRHGKSQELRPVSHERFHEAVAIEPGVRHRNIRDVHITKTDASVKRADELLAGHAAPGATRAGIGKERSAFPTHGFRLKCGNSICRRKPHLHQLLHTGDLERQTGG